MSYLLENIKILLPVFPYSNETDRSYLRKNVHLVYLNGKQQSGVSLEYSLRPIRSQIFGSPLFLSLSSMQILENIFLEI